MRQVGKSASLTAAKSRYADVPRWEGVRSFRKMARCADREANSRGASGDSRECPAARRISVSVISAKKRYGRDTYWGYLFRKVTS